MAFDLVSAFASKSETPFYVGGGSATAATLDEAPQQITLRFSAGVKIDPATLGGITVVRSGGVGDGFGIAGSKEDKPITPGSILVNDLPNQNEVVIRFAETLPDDSYRITVGSGAGGLKAVGGDTMTASRTIDLRLNLGAFVVSVVPQPVTRSGSTLSQDRDKIAVYFNQEDSLDAVSAQRALSYRLFEVDATGADVSPQLPTIPTGVTYDAATGKAVLTFAAGAIADGKLYRLQVGAASQLVAAATAVDEGNDDNSSFTTARDLETLDAAGKTVNGSISIPRVGNPTAAGTLATPAGPVEFPTQFGTIDEPGHRQEDFIPIDSHEHGLPVWATNPDTGPNVGYYNFKEVYGKDGQNNDLINAISEAQKQRAREVFELFSRYTGLQFIEHPSLGLTVVTGDVRALNPLIPPTAVAGMGSESPQMAIMSSLENWGSSEYGGQYFVVAMHEIGHALGLAHSYDIPSIMGAGLAGEPVFPGDNDTVHLSQLYPTISSDVDTYRFTLATGGALSAQIVSTRPGQTVATPANGLLDGVLSLYRQDSTTGKRTLIARNDDSFGRDSFIGLNLEPGTYFIAVSSAGNTSFNPEVSDSGYGGRTYGDYRLELGFKPASVAATTIIDTSGTLLDGDRDGKPGGAFNFWFNTASAADTVFIDKTAGNSGTGTIAFPYNTIKAALENLGSRKIIRIVGNAAGTPYLVGTDLAGVALADGSTFNVPANVTVMIDEGAIFKLRGAIIDVGSSSPLVSRGGASLQVLGTPANKVKFTSFHDDLIGGNSDGVGRSPEGGQWGGIVLRKDSDAASKKAFVNTIGQAEIRYGGGVVSVDSKSESFAPIQLESTRPTVAFNTITKSAGAAIAADPNSFEETGNRVGPELRGNQLLDNTTNGLFVKIRTEFGSPIDRLDVPARFKSTDIVYVIQENLLINGGVGGYQQVGGNVQARQSGRLTIDPGVVVKLQGSRIELERGTSQLVAEGTASQRVIFTSLGDNRFGAGGTFDTNGNLPNDRTAGDWGGIVLNAGSKASIDYAYIAYGGGQTPIEGTFDSFNVIETHQGDLRLAHSRIENNAAGTAVTSRTGRGGNAAATVFVRGAQPVILGNDFRDNLGATVSVNANSLSDVERSDPGRSTGAIDRDGRYDDNRGPLVRGNLLSYTVDAAAGRPAGGAVLGMEVRGEQITVESVWDDTDIVHVLRNEIIVENFHTATGVRLMSRPDASLIVKLQGAEAGFTASGYQLDIEDRIGGTVQIVGQPNYPVVLTSLKDDTVGSSVDPLGRIVKDTGSDGATTAAAGDWRSLAFYPYSNDRNVTVVQEVEKPFTGGADANASLLTAQSIGILAPNFATGTNTPESAQEKSGDENRRLGFEVHGRIASDDVSDVDMYTFFGYAGSEVWIDIDKTSPGLDSMIELLDASGKVLARSADSQTDASLDATTRGEDFNPLQKTAALGGDYYTVNPKDPGLRVVLRSFLGQPVGTLTQYFVRVRSQPRYEPADTAAANGGVTATTKAAYEADLRDAAKVKSGATSGGYELRLRLRQRDEKPGSTVRYADIRYPTIGIDVQGLPRNSQLLGETGETSASNDSFGTAQYVGNLLQSDRGAISIAGEAQSATDVDWYTFALNFEQIQSIGGVNGGTKTWATVFDIDYGDGFRGDLTIAVFNEQGQLLYVGRDSNIASDQPGAGQGNDFDDTSRGSLGKLDPFIGTVQLPAGTPTGGGSVEAGVPVTAPNPAEQLRYYVAVSSNQRLPTALDAFFNESATNSLIRLEPVNSVKRIAEDHIGFDGYPSGPDIATTYPRQIDPQQSLFDVSSTTSLSLNVTPFTLSDVTLFVYTSTTIETVDAMRGGNETTLYRLLVPPTDPVSGDITMRSDGKLFQYRPGTNAGMLYSVDTFTGGTTLVGDDNIPAPPEPGPETDAQETGLAARELGGSRSTFQLANAGLQLATINGTLRYTDSTAGALGTAVTYTWSFTADAAGNLTFTNVPTPAPPVGFARPTSGVVTVGDAVDKATATINWSAAIDTTKLQMSIQYTYQAPGEPNPNAVVSDAVDAVAFRRVPGLATAHQAYYSVRAGGESILYRGNATSGDASGGRIGPIAGVGQVNGLAFVGDQMFGVDSSGNFFSFGIGVNGVPTATATILSSVANASFAGLATGPQNLQQGAFANRLFAITTDGRLYCFNTSGVLQQVFDADGNGTADATSIATGSAPDVLGLAFSPLDINLWHPTVRRGREDGHGINKALDETRNEIDNDNFEINYQRSTEDRTFLREKGGASMYFGLEEYVRPTGSTSTPYLNYQSSDGQFGARDGAWQQDLTSTANIGNNYNLPGGAYGSLVTNAFSLGGSSYTDKPVLYFNYLLQTENAGGAYNRNDMRDSARVFISDNGGAWQVVATNNSEKSEYGTSNGELPNFVSASSALTTANNQHVQELYDTATWRQARIDLGKWAGKPNLRLRFDFSTAGEFDGTQRDAAGNLINSINGFANTTGSFKGDEQRSRERGDDNAHEGFFVDDVIIGYAERGEMVTGAVANQTGFFDILTPAPKQGYLAEQSLTGPYQLEIRRGTEYGVQPRRSDPDVAIVNQFDTNADLIVANGQLGDANQPREQGQFLIESNSISNASSYGIRIDAAAREAGTNNPVPGTLRKLPTLSGSRLVPGVVVSNNVIANSGTGGILFSGDDGTSPNLIRNPSFEDTNTPLFIAPGEWSALSTGSQTVTGWTVTAGDVDLINAGVRPGGAVIYAAVEGNRFFDLNGGGPGAIEQVIATVPGATYQVSFSLTPSPGVPIVAPGQPANTGAAMRLSAVGIAESFTTFTRTVMSNPVGAFPWEQVTWQFVADSASTILRFSGTSAGVSGMFIDNVSVALDASSATPAAIPYGRIVNNTIYGGTGYVPSATLAATTVSGQRTVTLPATSGIRVGMGVTGVGIPVGTLVSAIDNATSVTLSRAATASGTGVNLAFGFTTFGVSVTENAGPTLLNNLIANVDTGVSVDASSRLDDSGNQRTVIGTSAYYNVGTQVSAGVAQSREVVLTGDPFVNAATGNFYLAAGSRAIDSSLNSLGDRAESVVVNAPLGIPESPIIAPAIDRYGQVRADDPTQANLPGLGSNVFKDRGAIDRVDVFQPYLTLLAPQDGGATDADPAATSVQLKKEAARGVTRFALQLNDNGVGIDRATVTAAAFSLKRDGVGLVEGADYLFRYFDNTNQVVFESAAFFTMGTYVLTATSRPNVAGGAVGLLADLANNTLLPNQVNGTTSFAISLADVPGIPTGVAGVTGEGQASLSWTAPTAGNAAAVTDYLIQYSADGGSTWTDFTDSASAATSVTVTGLTNGTAYVFRVAAVNSVGQGEWSAASAAVTPQALPPSTPTGLAGVLGDGSVSLSWTAPSPGTSPITDYEIQFSSNGGSSWTSFSDGTSTATTTTVTPLVNGTAYVFRVRAVNKNGPSGWTAASAAVTPLAPASAPLVTSVLAGDSQVTVTWTTPANNGSPISGYVIQSSSNGGSTWTSKNVGVVTSSPVTGLTNGTAYVFRVAAVTAFGTGTFSTVTAAATPLGPSAAPSVTSVSAGDSQATVSWTTPASNGSPISGYTVEYTSNGGGSWTPTSLGVVNTTVVTSLVNGTTYSFRVAALTGFGTGLYSTPTALVTPLGPAAAPSVATVIAGDSQVSLSWGTPSGNGSAITGYVLQRSTDGGANWTSTNLGAVTSTVVGGLVNGTSYVFRLAAVTAFGTGTFSTPTSPVTPLGLPGTPTGLTVTGGDRSAAVSWTAPAVNGGLPITDYVVQYREVTSAPDNWLTLAHPASTATSAVVSGLTNGATYVFRVAAVTSFGQSGFTTESATVTPLPLAAAPTRLTGRAADGTVALIWTAPRVTGGLRITDYVIDFSSDNGATWTRATDAVSAATRATVAVPNGVTYVFRVAAVTAGGIGAYSVSSTPVTPFARGATPVAPTGIVGVGSGGTIALSWVGSPANAGGKVSDYVVQYRLATSSRWVTVRDGVSLSTSAIVNRLVAGRGYVFRVAAKNLAGQGAFSAETAEVIA